MNKTAYTLIALAAIAFATLFNYSAAFSRGKSSVPRTRLPGQGGFGGFGGSGHK